MEQLRAVRASEIEQYRRGLSKLVDAANSVTDPVERLVAAATYWIHDWSLPGTPRAFDTWLFSTTFPQYWKSQFDVDLSTYPWNSANIISWFATRARRDEIPTESYHPLKTKGWIRQVPRGWQIGNVWIGKRGDIASVAESTAIGVSGLRTISKLLSVRYPDMAVGELSRPVRPTATFEQWFRGAVG
jgi:hypothetical protein